MTDARARDFLRSQANRYPRPCLSYSRPDPELADNEALVAAVIAEARELGQPQPRRQFMENTLAMVRPT